jgi:hypothetical protein
LFDLALSEKFVGLGGAEASTTDMASFGANIVLSLTLLRNRFDSFGAVWPEFHK